MESSELESYNKGYPRGEPVLEYVREIDRANALNEKETVSLFRSHNFSIIDANPHTLRFQRSNRIATMMAFSPSRWRIDVQIDRQMATPDKIAVRMKVHTSGQIVTPREKRYFAAFFEELLTGLSPNGSRALIVAEAHAISRREAIYAYRENIGMILGLAFGLPLLIMLFHLALSIPFMWATVWGGAGSVALIYAWVFSAKNRAKPKRDHETN